MSRKVVYLNLLPDRQENAVNKLSQGLSNKRYVRNKFRAFFGNSYNVVRYDVYDMLNLSKLGILSWGTSKVTREEVLAVRTDCSSAWKIWLSAHGHMDCTDYVYSGQFGPPGPLCSWEQMCEFLTEMLPVRADAVKLELMICYAARTDDYLEGQQTNVASAKLKTSIAFKIFKQLIADNRKIILTARTGATGMDEGSGLVTVEQDEHAEIDHERRQVLETTEYKQLKLWFDNLQPLEKQTLGRKYGFTRVVAEIDRVAANTEDERKAKAYYRAQARYTELRNRQNDINDLNRYGTIRYATTKTGIKITNLYTEEVLYEGAML